MIKISNESEKDKAIKIANEFRENEVSNDIIIVLDKDDGYEIIPENEENKVTNKVISYEQALKQENINNEFIVYVGSQEQDNLTINANDMKNLLDKGVTLAFDSEIIDSMDSSNTEKEGITMLSIINLILKQNSPETKIIKGRNFVIRNNVTEEQETSLIKAYNNETDLRKLLSELGVKNIENSKFEELKYIALGIIQAVELQKINQNLNKDKISNADELLTMLGMYKLSSKGNKSYTAEREDKLQGNGKTTVEFLNELRAKVKANENDTAAIAGIIDILLAEQLNILDDIEKLLDIDDAKSIQSILAAA